jgi:hypothetical protein
MQGSTGRQVASLLMAQGIPVRALVHKLDSRSDELRRQGAEVVEGDLLNPASVQAAMRNVRRAYFTYPIDRRTAGGSHDLRLSRSRPEPGTGGEQPLLMLHSFRCIGLAFLVPGVVSPDLPSAFAHSAAYGDIIAAMLALLPLLLMPDAPGVAVAWIFNLWGTVDILNPFYQANHAVLLAGQLGAAFFLPTLVVPLLLITHGLAFRILLLEPQNESLPQESRHAA